MIHVKNTKTEDRDAVSTISIIKLNDESVMDFRVCSPVVARITCLFLFFIGQEKTTTWALFVEWQKYTTSLSLCVSLGLWALLRFDDVQANGGGGANGPYRKRQKKGGGRAPYGCFFLEESEKDKKGNFE